MPKSQYYHPTELRKKGTLSFKDIPLNQYDKTAADELKAGTYTKEDLINIYHDMEYIREFETMLMNVRLTKHYNGIDYVYVGPAHLYLGQEASAVGQSYLLDKNDFIFGNHRSHGEVIAKGLSCIRKMSDEELMTIMEEFFHGEPFKVIKENYGTNDVKEMATRFFMYGLMCELFGRDNGFAKGLGNSMHLFFIPFGIYPNNAIVGGSACVAAGAALFKKVNKKAGICIANAGDGSLGCGPVWEGFNFAAMDQLTQLWEDDYKGGLPVMFNFMNNGYGMGGQTNGETMAYGILARVGAGINPDQMHSERVDGLNPLAVIEAYSRKLPLLREGKGPCLLDVLTYRFCGHSTSDQNSYRTKEEIDEWHEYDCIQLFREELKKAGVATDADLDKIDADIKDTITNVLKVAINDELSPRIDLVKDPEGISKYMFSNQHIEKMEDRPCDVTTPYEENERVQKLAKKERRGIIDGKEVSKLKAFSYRDAIFEAVFNKFYVDPTLITYGEDVRDWGGAYGVYQGMTMSLPYHRYFNSPISESAIVASAVGYCMAGGRVVAELMYCDFIGRSGDEVFNQMAKWQSMSAGQLKMPLILRVSVGAKYGAQHSQDWTALTAHIPGLKVVFPATPYDAKGLMNAALAGTDPVVFFESQKLYDIGEKFAPNGVPEEYYEVEIGKPDIKREGKDVTILTFGATLYEAIKAADELKEKYGIEAEVIDGRTLVPFDYDLVLKSVEKTGKIVLASDACERGSHLSDIARNITDLAFDYLDAPPAVVGAKNWISPCPELEKMYFPQASWIIDAIHEKIMPLPGHVATNNFTRTEQLRKEREGV
ncbi:MAG: alpha-ketoacid dehydrogenase subunit alpha/beta [Eubacteriales bacterium]|jgi:2-oxoisovalerate dehydrogenase E1 component